MAEVIDKDRKRAARRTVKEARRYPLLAHIGATKVYTAEEMAEQRESIAARSAHQVAKDERELEESIPQAKATILALAGLAALEDYERYVARLQVHGTMLIHFWRTGAQRAEAGQVLHDPLPPFKPPLARVLVEPEKVLAQLRTFSGPASVGALCDRLSTDQQQVGVLDVVPALCELRETGRAKTWTRGGWLVA